MVKVLTPIFIFDRSIQTIADGGAVQEAEIDFQLGVGQAVELFASIAQTGLSDFDPSNTTLLDTSMIMTLHRRTGTLTDQTPAGPVDLSQGEVIHKIVYGVTNLETAAAGGAVSVYSRGPTTMKWPDLIGKPLLLAANLTIRYEISGAEGGTIGWDNPGFYLIYRYVVPTASELAQAFFGRA